MITLLPGPKNLFIIASQCLGLQDRPGESKINQTKCLLHTGAKVFLTVYCVCAELPKVSMQPQLSTVFLQFQESHRSMIMVISL